uniref:glutathione transferase n=1 Tax=Herdmania curvata TaxID=62068 RepID=Q69GU4_9ASCI|nr:glutathione-requiring prostaglandin D synthase [Herdmania curvata]
MATYKLYYFNARGRGEASRILFALQGVEYEDIRLEGESWQAKKPEMPFGQMPVLEITGADKKTVKLAQSRAISRYLAREFGYAGKNSLDMALVDSLVDHMDDLMKNLPFYEKDEEKKKKMIAEAMAGPIKEGLKKLEKYVTEDNVLVGKCITLADIDFQTGAEFLISFSGDENVLKSTPKLQAVYDKVANEPKIAAWIKKRPKTQF